MMPLGEFAFVVLLVLVLVGMAVYFGRQQLQTLRRLRAEPATPKEDGRYLRRQAGRRLLCCALMAALAGLMIGYFFLYPRYQEIIAQRAGREQAPTDEENAFLRFWAVYWISTLFLVMVLIFLAAVDFWSIARYGMRHRRQLQATHRAELEDQLARYRSRRNGNGEG